MLPLTVTFLYKATHNLPRDSHQADQTAAEPHSETTGRTHGSAGGTNLKNRERQEHHLCHHRKSLQGIGSQDRISRPWNDGTRRFVVMCASFDFEK